MNTASLKAAPLPTEQATEIEALLLETIDRLSDDQASRELREAADQGVFADSLWSVLDQIGLTRCLLPEQDGGSGLPLASAMRALKRTAHHALPLPVAESMIASRLLLAAGLSMPQGVVSVASRGNDGLLARVAWGENASHLVVVEAHQGAPGVSIYTGKPRLVKAARNLAGEPRPTLATDSMEKIAGAPLAQADELLLRYGALARSAQMSGALDRALALALQYANERVQFGRPIGKFQAVQHMLAVQASHAAAASAAFEGALDGGDAHPYELPVAIAKARISEAAGQGADIAHQVHGAMGFTREHQLHHVTRRLYAWRDEYGNEVFWQRRVGHAIASAGADALWQTLTEL
ncbi:MAG: acyl-CoA dehydrogenase family protein [Quisquiliibacterium sp.]